MSFLNVRDTAEFEEVLNSIPGDIFVEKIREEDENGITGLFKAIILNDYYLVQKYLHYVNPNETNKYGENAMHIFAEKSKLDSNIFKILLLYSADINLKDSNGWPPLFNLLYNNNPYDVILKWLIKFIEQGADINDKLSDGNNLIHELLSTSNDDDFNDPHFIKLLKYIIQFIDVNNENDEGENCLNIEYNNINIVKILLDNGCNPYNRDDSGWSALESCAVDEDNPGLIKEMINRGMNTLVINSISSWKYMTPINIALYNNRKNTTNILLKDINNLNFVYQNIKKYDIEYKDKLLELLTRTHIRNLKRKLSFNLSMNDPNSIPYKNLKGDDLYESISEHLISGIEKEIYQRNMLEEFKKSLYRDSAFLSNPSFISNRYGGKKRKTKKNIYFKP